MIKGKAYKFSMRSTKDLMISWMKKFEVELTWTIFSNLQPNEENWPQIVFH